ncbi:MAG: ATP-binding cassette domain-containing protein [Desulfobacter sp.]
MTKKQVPKKGFTYFLRSSTGYFLPYWPMVAAACLALAYQTVFRLLVPVSYQKILDRGIGQKDLGLLKIMVVVLVLGWVVNVAASIIQDYCAARAGAKVLNDLRLRLLKTLHYMPFSISDRTSSGNVLSLFSNDIAAVEATYMRSAYTFFFSVGILVMSVALLFFMEWRLALITFAALPLSLAAPRLAGQSARESSYARKQCEARVLETVKEESQTLLLSRTFRLRARRRALFSDLLDRLSKKVVRSYFMTALVGRLSSQSIFLVQILIIVVGVYFVTLGYLSIGTLIGFAALLLNISNAANYIASTVPDLIQATGGHQRIDEFLRQGVYKERKLPELPRFSRDIRFEKVTFGYAKNTIVLEDITFRIQRGESLAVVGPSGSGKSTVLKLLLKIYTPDRGSIYLDEKNIREYDDGSLFDQATVMFQDSVLFNTSILENIRAGKPGATRKEIEAAARQADIHDFIMALPDRYETRVSELGQNFSGGQRQRMALARALIRNPELLLLDEATSALDPATENTINRTLVRLKEKHTIIMVTHRLQSIVDMDRIIVLDKGSIMETGSHEALMARKKTYYDLWQKQAGFTVSDDGRYARCEPERLGRIDMFNDLDHRFLLLLANHMASECCNAHQTVFSTGDPGDRFYLIVYGKVAVQPIEGKTQTLHQGDYFGEIALLFGTARTATVTTRTPTLFLTLNRHLFNTLLDRFPSVHAAIKQTAESRLKLSGN